MKIYKKVRRSIQELDDIICDICKRTTKLERDFEYAELRADWGYETDWDTERHSVDICVNCYYQFIVWVKSQGGKVDVRKLH